MIQYLGEWLPIQSGWFGWVTGLSIVAFFGTLIVIPYLVVRIPADYFVGRQRRSDRFWKDRPWALRALWLLVKNLIGIVLLLAGAAMLLLPGQGLLTILIGLLLIDFPCKYRLERWLVTRPVVWRSIAWLRARAGQPPIDRPVTGADVKTIET